MMCSDIAQPQLADIKRDLTTMTQRWHELDSPVVFELRAIAPDRNKNPQSAKFAADWIDEAVEWAEDLNRLGFNLYVTRNPIRHDCKGSAKDEDVVAAFYVWADCDDKAASNNVFRFDGPKWNFAVTTGRVPHVRAHTYWELEEPCLNMQAWRKIQEGIAVHFGSDDQVVNPSRIMRLGGTVTYPAKNKIERGYTTEIATIRTVYDDDREPVAFEQMHRLFGHLKPQVSAHAVTQPLSGGIEIDLGKQPLDREREKIKALSGEEWNNAVFKLVGSYVRKGMSDEEIHALTKPLTIPPYTPDDTMREVQSMIDRTRRNPKFEPEEHAPEPEPQPVTATTIQDFPIDSSAAFLADLKPLEYLIDGLLPTGVTYSLTGHAGHGKTTLALQFALSVATGEMFGDRDTSQGSVLVLAGENPYNVKWQYAAALAARDMKPEDVPIYFVQGRFSIKEWTDVLRAKLEAMPDLKLIIVDSLQAFFEGDNDNDNTQMVEMAHKMRRICDISQRPAQIVIAHPAGKTPQKDNLVPRGGGAFLNEIDGNLTVWSQDASSQTLHHSQKFRGAGFDPMEWVMQVHTFDHLTDIHGTPLKLPVSRPETNVERSSRETQNDTILRDYLFSVDAGQPMSVREGAVRFAISRYRMDQIIGTAKAEKLIKRYAKTYVLTDGGRAYLGANSAGE